MNNRKQKIAFAFVGLSILLGISIWAYHAYLFDGTPEEESWAPVAGIFMGLIVGGICLVFSLINLFIVFKEGSK